MVQVTQAIQGHKAQQVTLDNLGLLVQMVPQAIQALRVLVVHLGKEVKWDRQEQLDNQVH